VSHPIVVGTGLVVALLLVAELAAVPLATRLVGDALGRCIPHGELTIERVRRPAVPRLLLGRADGVRLRVEDAELDGLQVAEAVVHAPRVVLPWALGDPTPGPATVELRIEEAAVAARLAELTPLGIRPRVTLDHGVVRVGVPATPAELVVTLAVRDDGALVLQPGAGPTGWWDRLGLARELPLPADVRVADVTIDRQAVTATVELDELPGGDGDGCEEPIAAPPDAERATTEGRLAGPLPAHPGDDPRR
jgi:hypothetical protein